MKVTANEYQEHQIFNDLNTYATFYEKFSDLNMMWLTQGAGGVLNMDTYVFTSMQGTIESIYDVLKRGRINDAYALLRKYYDSAIINIYTNLYLHDHFSIQNFVVEKIDAWIKGKEVIPSFGIMSEYIIKSEMVKDITSLLYSDGKFKKSTFEIIRQHCNEHTHYLYYKTLMLNDNKVYLEERLKIVDQFSSDLQKIFILHLAYLFYMNDHYLMARDYAEMLEMGESPDEDMQYLVAPFVKETFDRIILKFRPDIAEQIKKNSKMQL